MLLFKRFHLYYLIQEDDPTIKVKFFCGFYEDWYSRHFPDNNKNRMAFWQIDLYFFGINFGFEIPYKKVGHIYYGRDMISEEAKRQKREEERASRRLQNKTKGIIKRW